MANVTAPILLDSTGQSILTQLTNISSSLQDIVNSNVVIGSTDIEVGSPLPEGVLYVYAPDA